MRFDSRLRSSCLFRNSASRASLAASAAPTLTAVAVGCGAGVAVGRGAGVLVGRGAGVAVGRGAGVLVGLGAGVAVGATRGAVVTLRTVAGVGVGSARLAIEPPDPDPPLEADELPEFDTASARLFIADNISSLELELPLLVLAEPKIFCEFSPGPANRAACTSASLFSSAWGATFGVSITRPADDPFAGAASVTAGELASCTSFSRASSIMPCPPGAA